MGFFVGKRILIATRSDINGRGGSAFHLRNLVECLKANHHAVSIVQEHSESYDKLAEPLAFIGTNILSNDVVIADYAWMCTVFDGMPKDIIKICFVHDLRCRIIPCLEAIGYKDEQGWTEEKEAALLRKADILLVLNDEDAMFCKRMAPDAKITRIGIAMKPVEHNVAKEIPGRCIYVGSPVMENVWAIEWFKREVWPLVLKEVPTASLDVVMGGVDDIEEHYAEAQIVVVPHIMKGGLKIKVAEAFANGLPVVGNVCAFDGFYKPFKFLASDIASEQAYAIINILKDSQQMYYYRRVSIYTASQLSPFVYEELTDELA